MADSLKNAAHEIRSCIETVAPSTTSRVQGGGKGKYALYNWVEVEYEHRTFWITLFFNDVDESSGNPHTFFGKIQFWRDILSPAKHYPEPRIIGDELSRTQKSPHRLPQKISCGEETYLVHIFEKAKSFDPKKSLNDENFCFKALAEAFKKFAAIRD
ncbi:MAG: hypothetical protein FWE46_05600 [Coriobacteriia bacterium]|nr:hypothetical protein [Coriobacteriia bacterium]MCL2537091.1 hypothetical protein [Coriobacteriia bacterium]